jgi:hypothetical protein
MNKWQILLVVLVIGIWQSLSATPYTIDNFDSSAVDSLYEINVEGEPSRIDLSDNHIDFVEGTGSMDAHYVIGEFNMWGSFANLIFRTDSTDTWDWSISDSFSIWIKVRQAPTHPEYMVFRIHIADRPNPTDDPEEYIYENVVVFDTQADWFELKIPFIERETDGTVVPDSTGFVRFPDTWGGGTYNNRKLDRDKIIGYNLSAVVSGWDPGAPLPADSVLISYDNFIRFGTRAVPFIIFNGMTIPGQLGNPWTWGQSSVSVVNDSGATPGTNAIKWTQGDEWGNGWTGWGFDVNPVQNMLGGWMTDSVKFKMKAGAQTGALRIQFESGAADGKVGHVFTPVADNQWHDYAFPLRDFVYQDGATNFDTTAVNIVGMMAEASGVAGNVVWIDDWWTGKPDFDVVAPAPPDPVFVVADQYSNLVTWNDPGEEGETYNLYYSTDPIIDVTAPGVNVVDGGWAVPDEGSYNFSHLLFSPLGDSTVNYYYAVTCTDEAGNESDPAVYATVVPNTAKGIATLSLTTPSGFVADGNLGDWTGIPAFSMAPSLGSHIVTNTTVSSDADLSVDAYLAGDNTYFYFAFDVTDDVVDTTAANSWEKDCPDLFIGLYNWVGPPHGGYSTGGSTPDYQIRFLPTEMFFDAGRGTSVTPVEYHWGTKFPTGYVIEGRISWVDLAAVSGDDVFDPTVSNGYRIPIDFATNDADGGGVREGIMTWSLYNDDNSWQSPRYWLHTWVGNLMFPVGIGDLDSPIAYSYSLEQNYPNPFNPSTQIQYSLKARNKVELFVYNALGQKVATLVNGIEPAGVHTVQFDARNLASGIYFYHLKTAEFEQVKKMILLK